jgi:hypothetical protein
MALAKLVAGVAIISSSMASILAALSTSGTRRESEHRPRPSRL